MRKLYWYVSSYVRKHGLLVLLTFVVGIVLFSFLVPVLATALDAKPRQYIGLVGSYQLTTLPPVIQRLISHGLTSIEEDGSVIPDLTERWTTEDEGTTYRFVVKKNLYWQDGKQLEPSDVSYPFTDLETIATPNDIIFKLPDAFVPFPTVVSQPIFRPATIKRLGFFSRPSLIGLGEFTIISYKEQGNRLTELVLDSDQQRRIYRFYLTEADAVTAFKRGEVDILPDLASLHDLGQWPDIQTTSQPDTNRYLAVFFNLDDPIFTKNVRQALSYAAHKPTDDTRVLGPISRSSWAYLDGAKDYAYDMSRGIERLLSEIPPDRLEFELTTLPLFEAEATQLKQDWEELGRAAVQACQSEKAVTDKTQCDRLNIQVNIRINPFADTNQFQALLIGQESPSDPDQYSLWHSDQPSNFSHYRNTRIDSLLERGRQTVDQNERLAIYREFQQFLLEDAPAVFLRSLQNYQVSR